MGYSCTVEQESEAIQSLEDNGYPVSSQTIGAWLSNDSLFFQEMDGIVQSESVADVDEFELDLSGWD